MTTTQGQRVLEAARYYRQAGECVIPIPFRHKKPILDAWQNLRLTEQGLPAYFHGDCNIGILTGEPSIGLVDVDCDVPEALVPAAKFLPPTDRIHGRPGNPRSHYWYRTTEPAATAKFQFAEGGAKERTMLIELRSTGLQTMVPPSVHPSGEALAWERAGAAARVSAAALRTAVMKVAACALLARHWPGQGSRDDAAMALTGMLLRGGWGEVDTDEFITTMAEAASDEEWRTRGKARQTARKLAEGEKATGAPTLATLLRDGQRVVTQARQWLGLSMAAASESAYEENEEKVKGGKRDSSFSSYPKPPEKMAPAAYYGLAGDIVAAIEPHTEADPVAILAQFLALFGNIAGRHACFRAERDWHYPNLFAALVGDTAKARKGSSWGQAIEPYRGIQAEYLKRHIISGLSSGEGLIHTVRDYDPTEAADGKKQKVILPPTILQQDKRLLVREGEFASILRMFARDGNTLSTTLREAWDGLPLGSLTKNAPERATGAHISIIGHITRDELRRYLSDTDAANGFANRFLWFYVRRSKLLPDGGDLDSVNFIPLQTRLQTAIEFAQGLDTHVLTRDPQARLRWHEVYERLSEGYPGLFGAMTARAEAQVMRLATIYALLDCSKFIRADHMDAALAVWDYAEDSVRYVFGDAIGDPVADALLRALRDAKGGMTRWEITNRLGRNVKAADIDRALQLLEERQLAWCEQIQTGEPGWPAERWHAVRTPHGTKKGQAA